MTIKGKTSLKSIVKAAETCSRGARTYDMTVADARALVDALFALIKGKVAACLERATNWILAHERAAGKAPIPALETVGEALGGGE